jgi:mRNA interferase HigB
MQVIAKRTLREFAETPLTSWHKLVAKARWTGPSDIKQAFGTNVDFVAGNRVIFDIGGNKYRLVAYVLYAPYHRVLIKFVGTHSEYDGIDPETV